MQLFESTIRQPRQRVAAKQEETFNGIFCALSVAMQLVDSGTKTGLVAGTVSVMLLTPVATSFLFCK